MQRDARQPQHIVRKIEGEEGDETYEGNETPAIGVDAVDQPLEEPAGSAADPIAGDIARDQEGERGAQGGADKIQDAAPERTEQGAAGKRERCAGDEGDGRDGVKG